MDGQSKKKVYDKEEALELPDSLLYDVVGLHNLSQWKDETRTNTRERMCRAIRVSNQTARPYDARPQTLPFPRGELEKFIAEGLPKLEGHYWSVLWASPRPGSQDIRYDDDYRGVFVFNTVEFMIRPPQELRAGDVGQPKKVHIFPLDVKEILTLALQTNPGLGQQMTMAMGLGSAKNPDVLRSRTMPDVSFEWRIDLAEEEKVERLVLKWRGSHFGGVEAYRIAQEERNKEKKMKDWIHARASAQASGVSPPEGLLRSYVPETQREQGPSQVQPSPALFDSTPQMRKRSNFSLGDDTVPGPSRKRLSTGSQSARDSRAGTESQSGTRSMGMMRPFPLPSAGDPSARLPEVKRFNQASTELWRRPEASSGTVGRGNTYTVPGFQSHTSSLVGSSSRTRPHSTLPPMAGVTRGISALGITSAAAPTIDRPGQILATPEPRQGEPRGSYRDGATLSVLNQSQNVSPVPGPRGPRPLQIPRSHQRSPDNRDFNQPILRPLAPHVYNNTAPPRQPPPTLAPIVIPPLDVPPRGTPSRIVPHPNVNPPSMLPRGMPSNQDNRSQNQSIGAGSPGGQYSAASRQDPRVGPQGVRTGQGGSARAPQDPDIPYGRIQGRYQSGSQGYSGPGSGESSRG